MQFSRENGLSFHPKGLLRPHLEDHSRTLAVHSSCVTTSLLPWRKQRPGYGMQDNMQGQTLSYSKSEYIHWFNDAILIRQANVLHLEILLIALGPSKDLACIVNMSLSSEEPAKSRKLMAVHYFPCTPTFSTTKIRFPPSTFSWSTVLSCIPEVLMNQ